MNAFAGTSAYYRRFRPGIPVALAALLDQAAPTDSPRRLLDIGSGPGLVVRALLQYFDNLFTDPHLFRDRRDNFELAVTDALTPFAVSGVLTEDNAFTVLTARRPSAHEGR